MLVLNAEVLFVDSLVFLRVVSVVRGGGLQGSRAGGAVGRARGASVAEAGSGGGPTVDGSCRP